MKKILYYLMMIFCITTVGCSEIRTILGSDKDLLLPIENYQSVLKPDFQFLGKAKAPVQDDWEMSLRGSPLENDSIIYGQVGSGNIIEKALIVRTYQTRGQSSLFLPNMNYSNKSLLLDSGTVILAAIKLPYSILIDRGEIGENEKKLISNKRLLMSDCYLLKTYSGDLNEKGVFAKSISHILYYERIGAGNTAAACKQFIQADASLSEKENVRVSDFSARADKYVGMLIGGSVGEGGGSVPEKPVQGASELERKLSHLKSLLDKGLITQEDYNKKKLKLLEDF